jgi:serine/threonine-protein kinase
VVELNRDLLLTVLATAAGAASRPGLEVALAEWRRNPNRPLSELIQRECRIGEERMRVLKEQAGDILREHPASSGRKADDPNAHDRTLDVPTEPGDSRDQTLHDVDRISSEPGDVADQTVPDQRELRVAADFAIVRSLAELSKSDRFEPISEHARGGIGLVYLARDGELQREVALKVIQDRFVNREDQLARFLLEAEITGNLEHPGIVPVYSLGRNALGQPYYAMRFIRGEPLGDAIRRFHKAQLVDRTGRSSARWGFEFRQLLGRFLDVCDAIDYAHSRGVIHRDIKPSNIMLGRYGETLVVDWGLAKVMGQADIAATRAEGSDEPSMAESAVSFSGETQPGTTIGTPSYMSPEQARGQIEEIGTHSDVYSLGVTLYELLTGRTAFKGETPTAVLEKVMRHEFRAPRSIFPSMPRALEAICLKAMAARREDRYLSVRALARDLEHWLADEPTSAYVELPLERMGRWFRQHRTWTSGVAASLVGLTLASVIAAFAIDAARRNETEAKEDAEINLSLARQAVDDYLTTVSEDTLFKEQDSVDNRALRLKLLRTALPYYQRFVQKHGQDPALRRQLALSYYRIGVITREIGSDREARKAFLDSLGIWKKESDDNPADDLARYHLALAYLAVGDQDTKLREYESAKKWYNPARLALEELAKANALWPEYESSLADCYSAIGIAEQRLNTEDSKNRALDMLEQSRAIQRKLVDRFPENLDYQKSLIEKINVMGFVHHGRKKFDDALTCFNQVRDLCDSLLSHSGDTKPVKFRDFLGLSLHNIGSIHIERYEQTLAPAGDAAVLKAAVLEAAEKAAQSALDQRIALASDQPSVTKFRLNLAESYDLMARILLRRGKDKEAIAASGHSVQILRDLVRANSDGDSYQTQLTEHLGLHGWICDQARDHREAINAYSQVIDAKRVVLEQSRKIEDRIALCGSLEDLAEQYLDLGDVRSSLEYYRELVKHRREVVELDPVNREYVGNLSTGLARLAISSRLAGRPSEAVDAAKSWSELWRRFGESTGDFEGVRMPFTRAVIECAAATTDLGKPDEAAEMLAPQIAPLVKKWREKKADFDDVVTLSSAYWELARARRLARRLPEAKTFDDERLNLWMSRSSAELARLAAYHLSRAIIVGYGETLEPEQVRAIHDTELDRAAASLSRAIEQGLSDMTLVNFAPQASPFMSEGSPLDPEPLLSRNEIKSTLRKMSDSKQIAPKPGGR